MERGSDDVLVAVAKPARGREMIATAVPIDMFDSMKHVSSRDNNLTTELPNQRKDKVETFYEGYVDGKKYLVPDSNLEAMKDIINLGMRQRRSTRFRHQTSADVEDIMTPERIEKMLSKIRDLTLSTSDVSENSSLKVRGKPREEEASWSESKSQSSSMSRSKVESDSRSESQKSSSKKDRFSSPESLFFSYDSVSSEYGKKEQQSENETGEEETDDCYLRLVLSGHFKNNEDPVYIIQELNRSSNLFCNQSADLTSSQTQGNVHIFMAGKLFNENILEETDGKPASLNLKPNKIIIDPSKCKVFRSYFENTYSRTATDITIKGEFLQNVSSMDITPFLSVIIKQNNIIKALSNNTRKESDEKRPSILVRNRLSTISSNTVISKDIKRVSFKEGSDEEELLIICKSINKRPPDDSLTSQEIFPKKEGYFQSRLIENQRSSANKKIIVKRKFLERIFYFVTENSFFKKLFTKSK